MELLYGAGFLVAVLVLGFALKRFRDYRNSLRIKLEPVPPGPDPDRHFPELGEVRVRPRSAFGSASPESEEPVEPRLVMAPPAVAAVPHSHVRLPVESAHREPAPAAEEHVPVLLTPVPEPEEVQPDLFANEAIAPPPLPRGARREPAPPSAAQRLYEKPVEPVRPVRAEPEVRPHVDVEDVIALHVVAQGPAFSGEDLLRCILSYGLRFGEMAIFHRHEQPTGQGRILFSMAKAVEPGTFDLEAMTGEEVPGVSFFLSLPGVNSIHAYDIMVDTAKRLATELQGQVLDEQQQPLTRQLIEHYRERVQEFERRRLMQRPFA